MRNYSTKPSVKKTDRAELLKCPITKCNKKYKREDRRKQHVEKDHYYETRNSNYFEFDHDVRAKIYESAASYIVELYEIRNGVCCGESFAKNLLPQLYGKDVSTEDLERITIAQASFARNLLQQNLHLCDWSSVMDDLQSFFNLGLPYYDTNFCPTLAIDFLWHAMMQLPDLYVEICRKSCGEIIPHCSNHRSGDEDAKRYEYFLQLFKHKFNRNPCPFTSADIIEDITATDLQQIFLDLRDKELKQSEHDRLLNEEAIRERNEKLRIEKEKELAFRKQIAARAGISERFFMGCDFNYYWNGYYQGYRGKDLINYAARRIKADRSMPATC